MPAGFFLKIFIVAVLISSGFAANIQANGSPRIINEKFVVSALQTIGSAQATFQATAGNRNYGTLEQLGNKNFIDGVLATGEKYFYRFTITIVDRSENQPARFEISAVPNRYGKSGKRSFFLDESGVVRGADRNGEPANSNDPSVPINCGESGAIDSMRWLQGAEETYRATVGNENYGTLTQLAGAGLINAYLSNGENCGYSFRVQITIRSNETPARFEVRSVPTQYGVTGLRSFFVDESGVIRGADRGGAEANSDDPPIE
jgi:hypothetical protein